MRNKGMRNRVVVITGASSGFGRGAALKFAEGGAKVVLAARRRRELKEVAKECEQLGAKTLVVDTDVSNSGEVEELAERAVAKFGKIDVWVNNAGVGAVGHFEETPLEEHEQVIKTNLLGTIYGSYAALQRFIEEGRGVLINVGSIAGKIAAPYLSSYSASKFGVRGLGIALRQELEQNGENNIHVCTVMPGSHDTPFFEHAANYSGKPVEPIPPVYDPQKVVDVIYELALHPEDEVIVGEMGKVASVSQRLAPTFTQKLMGKRAHKSQMKQQKTAEDKSGSVFQPEESGKGVYGGWLEKEDKSNGRLGRILGFAVPIGMGAAYLALQRARSKRSEHESAA
jgi:short-subunit dehydrogenase